MTTTRRIAKILLSVSDAVLARIERALGTNSGPGRDRSARRAMRRIQDLVHKHGSTGDSTEAVRVERDAR